MTNQQNRVADAYKPLHQEYREEKHSEHQVGEGAIHW
jgi:hypothetical protein